MHLDRILVTSTFFLELVTLAGWGV